MNISSLAAMLFGRRHRSFFGSSMFGSRRNSNRGYYAGGGGFLGLVLTGLSIYRFVRNRRTAGAY